MGRALIVDSREKHKINALRMEEYKKASNLSVDLLTLQWKQSDDESYVMVLENEGKVVATMRGEIIQERSLLEKKLECPWTFPLELTFPVLLLSRAATDSTCQAKGLNMVQRYWFLKLAASLNIPYVVGTFVSGSPRERSLLEMGYQFFENEQGWQQSTFRSLGPVKVVVLDMKKNGEEAISYCERNSPKEQFPFEGEFPDLKIVSTI